VLFAYCIMGFNDRWLAAWVEDVDTADGYGKDTYIGIYIVSQVPACVCVCMVMIMGRLSAHIIL
jgi:hypothetical protein